MDIFLLTGTHLHGCACGYGESAATRTIGTEIHRCDRKSWTEGCGLGLGVCVGDYNNDGFEDLFCTYYGQNELYRNNGDGTFTDVTKHAGLVSEKPRWGAGCTFVDYNRDGHLDLFVSNIWNSI